MVELENMKGEIGKLGPNIENAARGTAAVGTVVIGRSCRAGCSGVTGGGTGGGALGGPLANNFNAFWISNALALAIDELAAADWD